MNTNNFAGILLVSDMDGTLLNSQHVISLKNRIALNRFVAQGGSFTVATGRIETSVEPYLLQLPINVPAILYNGAMIYDFQTREALWTATLPKQTEQIIPSLSDTFPGLGIEIYANSQVYLWAENALTKKHLRRENLPFKHPFSLKDIPEPWQKVLLAWEPEKLEALESYLLALKQPLDLVRSEAFFLEILPENINKGSALERLIHYTGLDTANVVAIGDNPNDREMLRTAAVGIAVDNAHPRLKRSATFSTCGHDDHAIAEVIDWIKTQMLNHGWRE
ncbi:MAG: Cof-type HAD-IIB family hydrolase [Desulfitobacteriaceae bacterium]